MKSVILIIFVLLTIACVFEHDEGWKDYKKKHKKSYKNKDDEDKRYKHYKKNDAKIKEHNEKFARKEVFYEMGHNQFSDKDEEEIRNLYLHEIPQNMNSLILTQNKTPSSYPIGPASISYKHFCLPVLDQADCGSCWAFATSAQVEVQLKRKYSSFNARISPQYLLDCAPNSGCTNGGVPKYSFEFMHSNGLVDSNNYPYLGHQQSCNTGIRKMTQKIATFMHHDLNGNEQYLKNILANAGPVVISMYVESSTFMHYHSGIYWDVTCPNKCETVNHAMVLVGYGSDVTNKSTSIDYWLFKNSFGSTFGESGYIRMIRNVDGLNNNCNVACFIDFSE